jgi:hypothetical protein
VTISARSYGSTADVAARVPGAYTDATTKLFTTATNPTLTTVETYIDEISAIANVALADARFAIPVTQADAKKAIGSMVNDIAADMASASNSAGRFFTDRALNGGLSMMAQIRKDVREWVEANAQGLENLGAERSPQVDTNTTMRVGVYRITRGRMDDGRTI